MTTTKYNQRFQTVEVKDANDQAATNEMGTVTFGYDNRNRTTSTTDVFGPAVVKNPSTTIPHNAWRLPNDSFHNPPLTCPKIKTDGQSVRLTPTVTAGADADLGNSR